MTDKNTTALMETICSIDSPALASHFFTDLCTPQELASLSQRWQVAKLLHAGMTTRAVSQKTGASTATISRVNRCMHYGTGYKTLLHHHTPKNK